MRPISTPLAIIAGLLGGAALAFVGTRLAPEAATPASATLPATSTTTTEVAPVAPPVWYRQGEVALGPTVLIPGRLQVSAGEVSFEYELRDIAPADFGINTFDDARVPVAAPELWTLFTATGPIPGSTANIRARAARFPVSDDFDPASIQGIRLDRYRIRLPMVHDISIAQNDTSEIAVDEETTISLRFLLPQAQNTIVQFTLEDPFDGFDTSSDGFAGNFRYEPQVRGLGPGWSNVGPTETGIQLTYTGDSLPDPIPLRVTTHSWVKMPAAIIIDAGEMTDE